MATRRTMPQKKKLFLADFAANGNVSLAVQAAGIARSTHYEWLNKYPKYKVAYEAAEDEAIDSLELEARRRAMHGTDEPVFYQGFECGVIRKYSDTLLMFLLNGLRPGKHKHNVNVSGDLNVRIVDDIAK